MWSDCEREEVRFLIDWCVGTSMSRLPDLSEWAVRGHGYNINDSGVTYPGDLDDYDRAQGEHIAPGYLKAYTGSGREWLVPEPLYLAVLAEMLDAAGFSADAARVRARALVAE